MKIRFTFLLAFLMSMTMWCQTGVNYKAVITDDFGNPLINTPVAVQFGIYEDFDGLLVYSETHNTTTDQNGKIILTIGEGTPIFGTFENLFESPNPTALNVQIDIGAGLVDFGNSEFNYVPYAYHAVTADFAENLSGLERIIENGSAGWRLIGSNPDFFGDIGFLAVDLSVNTSNTGARGARGDFAFASGLATAASGLASTAQGFSNLAAGSYSASFGATNQSTGIASFTTGRVNSTSADYSFASGRENTVSGTYSTSSGFQNTVEGDYAIAAGNSVDAEGDGSFAFGNDNSAEGNNSMVGGSGTRAIGNNSIAFGFQTFTSGNRSAAFGNNTYANAFSSFVIGRHNEGGGDTDSWVGQDPLFEIGIGAAINDTENAMTVLKNGNVGIGTSSPLAPLHVSGVLRIGSETIEDGGSNRLRVNASLLPDVDNSVALGISSLRWIGVWAVDGTINTSDRRDKENITDLNYGLSEIQKLKPVSFNWKKRPEAGVKLGLIAQDLNQVIPEVVMTEEIIYSEEDRTSYEKKPLDRMGVYYSDLIPVLIKAIQEQQEIIDSQKEENLNQKSELAEVKGNLQSLLDRIEILERNAPN